MMRMASRSPPLFVARRRRRRAKRLRAAVASFNENAMTNKAQTSTATSAAHRLNQSKIEHLASLVFDERRRARNPSCSMRNPSRAGATQNMVKTRRGSVRRQRQRRRRQRRRRRRWWRRRRATATAPARNPLLRSQTEDQFAKSSRSDDRDGELGVASNKNAVFNRNLRVLARVARQKAYVSTFLVRFL